MQPRVCGSCTACCKTHPVVEIDKPMGKWCPHCKVGQGCAIYSSRPAGCEGFQCQWHMGFGEEKHRPDHTKVVLDLVRYEGGPSKGILQIFESAQGGLKKDYARLVSREALESGIYVSHIYLSGKKKLFRPPQATKPLIAEEDFELCSIDEL